MKQLTDDEMISTILRSLRKTRKQFAHLYGPKAKSAPKRAAKTRRQASGRDNARRRAGQMAMKNPPHPGLSVRYDCLEPLGLTVTDAARKLGISRKQLSDIVNARAGISPEMAIRLDKAFGGGAETWSRLQAAYDLAQAMKHSNKIKVERLKAA